jgi:hypothetical protein
MLILLCCAPSRFLFAAASAEVVPKAPLLEDGQQGSAAWRGSLLDPHYSNLGGD